MYFERIMNLNPNPEQTDATVSGKGILYVVSTPIGNNEDITARAVRMLRNCDLVVCEEAKEGAQLLRQNNLTKPIETLNEQNEVEKSIEILSLLKTGKSIALVSDCGTPVFADPGLTLVQMAIQNKITVVPVPGASSIMAGLVASGFTTNQFLYGGFLNRERSIRIEELVALSRERRTVIILETPYRLMPILEAAAQVMPDRNAYIGCNLTLPFETHHYGTFSELLERFSEMKFKGEFIIVFEGANATDADREIPVYIERGEYRSKGPRRYDDHRGSRFDDRPRKKYSDRSPRYFDEAEDDAEHGKSENSDETADTDDANIFEMGEDVTDKYTDSSEKRHDRREGGFNRDRCEGGFNRDRREGGFNRDRREGGFNRDRREGGFNRDRNEGGFNRDRREGGFNRDRNEGGFNRDRREGGFNRDRNEGGFNKGGFNRDRNEGGFNRDRKEGGFNRDRREGGFNKGGFNRDRNEGGFNRDRREGGFNRDRREGGFNRDRREGGFEKKNFEHGDSESGTVFGREAREGGFGRKPFGGGKGGFSKGGFNKGGFGKKPFGGGKGGFKGKGKPRKDW